MPRILSALVLFLALGLPPAAHADTFKYTIVDNVYNFAPTPDISPFRGTYTFTTSSLLIGDTFVYGPGFSDPHLPGVPYVYAADFSAPAASGVSLIELLFQPLSNNYAFTLFSVSSGATGTSLIPDKSDLTRFVADYGTYGYETMQIEGIATSPVPEPSTITMLALGAMGVAARLRTRPRA